MECQGKIIKYLELHAKENKITHLSRKTQQMNIEKCVDLWYIYRMKGWEDAGEISIYTFGCGRNIIGF